MPEATHEQFRQLNYVSIFVGDFEDEDTLDDYLDSGFVDDFGFEIDAEDGPEADVEAERLEIRSLVAQYSDGDQFCVPAGEVADSLKMEEANTAIVFYHFKYDPSVGNPPAEAPVKFLGAFPFEESVQP